MCSNQEFLTWFKNIHSLIGIDFMTESLTMHLICSLLIFIYNINIALLWISNGIDIVTVMMTVHVECGYLSSQIYTKQRCRCNCCCKLLQVVASCCAMFALHMQIDFAIGLFVCSSVRLFVCWPCH